MKHKSVYLMLNDITPLSNLIEKLEKIGYQAQSFSSSEELFAACEETIPYAFIIDAVIDNGVIIGAKVFAELREKGVTLPPVVFVSENDTIDVRLAIVRTTANHYFCRLSDFDKLTNKLVNVLAECSVDKIEEKPGRVLIIGEDTDLIKEYERGLSESGMKVVMLENSIECLKILTDFKPDIVFIDDDLSYCSGSELLQVIRQDDTWSTMPILFLSSQSNINRSLKIIEFGGDAVLEKPFKLHQLVSAAAAWVKRARRDFDVNVDLNTALIESQFQIVTMNQHNHVSISDTNGKIISVNDKLCDISGYSREELVGQNHRILKSGLHEKSFYQKMWNVISRGEIWQGTVCNLKKTGEEFWSDSTIVPFLDKQGNPYKFVCARTDITDRIKAEELQREDEEKYRLQFEFSEDPMWLIFGDKFIMSNQAAVRTLGYDSLESLINTHPSELSPENQSDGQPSFDKANKMMETAYNEGYHRFEWLHKKKNGEEFPVDVALTRIPYGGQQALFCIWRDISERKKNEKALIDARKESDRANRAKSDFLSRMSHELRTPLNAILGFGQLLDLSKNPPLTELQQESVSEILNGGRHLRELINDVLDLAKIESDHMELYNERVSVAKEVYGSIQFVTELARQRGISITLSWNKTEIVAKELLQQNYTIVCDKTKFKQVLLNLLSNAVKYNKDNGNINVSCEVTASRVRISVTDTGSGLDESQQARLFIPFERLGASQTSIEGIGFGLVITKNIVELMGGNIGVESQEGKGCTFWFELPNELPSQV